MENSRAKSSVVRPRISAIIVASKQGIQLCKTTRETINGARFVAFVRDQLVPTLNPYNGQNPNFMVLMGRFVKVEHLYTTKRDKSLDFFSYQIITLFIA